VVEAYIRRYKLVVAYMLGEHMVVACKKVGHNLVAYILVDKMPALASSWA